MNAVLAAFIPPTQALPASGSVVAGPCPTMGVGHDHVARRQRVREAVEQKLARRQRTFAEILKPIHDAVAASGMSDQDVDALLVAELRATRAERRASRQSP